jgi:hypothetical protein
MHWTFITMNMNTGWQRAALVSFPFLCHFVKDNMCLALLIACFRYSGLNLFVTCDQHFPIGSREPAVVHSKCLPAWKAFTNKSNVLLKKLWPHSVYVPQMAHLFKYLVICALILMIHGREMSYCTSQYSSDSEHCIRSMKETSLVIYLQLQLCLDQQQKLYIDMKIYWQLHFFK